MGILAAALLGLVAGEAMRRRLNRLAYRLPYDEEADVDETVLPSPGSRWWVPVVLSAAWACVVWRCPAPPVGAWRDLARLVGWLAFSGIGLGMAAIDLDVRRLPDRGQIWLAGASLACGVLAFWGAPIRLVIGLCAGLACGLVFLVIHSISRGSLGLGDVKLVMTCGWWLGLISLAAVFAGLMAACLLAVAYSLVARQRQFAFGPWLAAGTVVAGLYAA